MKKYFSAIALIASLIFLGCNNKPGSSSDTINLKFNLPKGAGYDYNMEMTMAIKGNISGQPMNVDNKMAMGYHFGVIDDSAGWKKISSTISRIAMNVNTAGMNINYDSDKPADSSDAANGAMGKVLGAMKGGEFTFTMNEQGKIGSVTGINEMMQRMMQSINVPDANAMAQSMGTSFNEENFKQNIQQAFGIYPGKPVKPGDTWTSAMNMNNSGMEMKMDNTYTLESVSGDNANVKVDSKISSPSNATASINGTMKGTMKYDISSGVPVDGDLDMNMNMNVNSGGQQMPMTMDIKMKITGKKS